MFAVIDGVLLTPPADGRILPGTTRAAVLRAARDRGILTGEKPLTLGELAEATEVFVSNAVAGVLPVTAFGNRTWRPGPVTADLAAALAARRADSPLTRGATGHSAASPSAAALPHWATGRPAGRPVRSSS